MEFIISFCNGRFFSSVRYVFLMSSIFQFLSNIQNILGSYFELQFTGLESLFTGHFADLDLPSKQFPRENPFGIFSSVCTLFCKKQNFMISFCQNYGNFCFQFYRWITLRITSLILFHRVNNLKTTNVLISKFVRCRNKSAQNTPFVGLPPTLR